jgi:TP901 family phage tail tape measure protein
MADTPEKIGYSDLFDFTGRNPLTAAVKSINSLEEAYSKLSANLIAEAIRIGQSQNQVNQALTQLSISIKAINIATEAGRRNGAKIAADIDNQTRAYAGLKSAQKGAEVTNKAVAGSLEALRQQLQADRKELIALGQAANPEQLARLAASILDTKTKSEQLEKAVRGTNSIFSAARGSYNALLNENRQLAVELKNLGGVFEATGQRTQENIAREAQLKEKLAANTEVLKRYDTQLNQHFRNVGNYANSIIEAVRALNDEKAALSQQANALRVASTATNLDAKAQNALQAELVQTNDKLSLVNKKLNEYGVKTEETQSNTERLKNGLKDAGKNLENFISGAVIATIGLTALAATFKKVIGLNIDYSDALADTAKTTGLSIAQTGELAEKLKTIDTRDSIDELLKIAEVGGQLGTAKEDIEGFTKAIDTAGIALKNDFGGDIELIATELGKINTIFKNSDKVGIERALLDIGSAINELGAAGAATAPYITDFAKRVGQAATNAGLGLDKVLGLGAAFEELGFSAEVSGTATNKLLAGLAGNSGKFFAIAKIADANLTLKEFKNIINNDANKALNLFLAGLRKGGASTTDFAQLVQSLGLKSGGAVQALTALAKNSELVADRQRIANEQLDNGQSLATEAAIKNNNLAASYAKVGNALKNLVTGDGAISKGLKGVFDYTAEIIKGNIDWKESLLTLIPLYAQIKSGSLIAGPNIVINKAKKATDDYGLSLELNAKTSQRTAAAAENLLRQYEQLSNVINPTVKQQQQLTTVTQKLQDLLGDSAVKLDKERGQYVLNTDAVSKNIIAKRGDAEQTAKTLAQRVVQLDTELVKEQALAKAIQERVSAAQGNLNPIIQNPGTPAATKFVDNQRSKVENPVAYGKPSISAADIANYDAFLKLTTDLEKAENQAATTEVARGAVFANLKRIFPDLISAQSFLTAATKEEVKSTLEDTKAKKGQEKAARDTLAAIDALAKAQYELAKFRGENRAGTFERQADNEANSEEFRTEAAKKGAAKRIEVAQLEQAEKVRLAVAAARDIETRTAKDLADENITAEEAASSNRKISATLALQRTLISEQYAARVKEIERDLTKEQLAIHNELLAQLREIDKIRIESEQAGLEKVIADERNGYDVRVAAIKQFQANVVLLAKATYDAEVAAANGSVTKIQAALDRFSQTAGAARDKVKPFDSTIANDDTDIDYKQAQIGLEDARANGLVTEKEYQQNKQYLENKYLQEHLTNLQVEKDGTKEALDEELNLVRKKNEEEIALEKKKREEKLAIIEETTQLVGAIGDGLFQNSLANIDNELAAVQKQKDSDLAIAGNNAKAKKKIEDDAAKQTAALQRKKAQTERAQALFSIALQTGIAVTKAVAESPETFGLPFSAFALANGLVQAALVLSKPIPAYAKGIESAPGGVALVGEAGAELLQFGGKEKLVTGPTLVDLPAGTRVVNHEKTVRIFEERSLSTTLADGYRNSEKTLADVQRTITPGQIAGIVAGAVAIKFNELKDAIKDIPGSTTTWDEKGIRTSIKRGQQNTEYFDSRYKRQ